MFIFIFEVLNVFISKCRISNKFEIYFIYFPENIK